jgi:hypothetical protein
MNSTVGVPLYEALFAVRREEYPRYESRYYEEEGDMLLRNVVSNYSHTVQSPKRHLSTTSLVRQTYSIL